MRERLDCVLVPVGVSSEHMPAPGVYANGRLHLHASHLSGLAKDTSEAWWHSGLALQRFDACVFIVQESNLIAVRQALSASLAHVRIPILGVLGKLKAPAINDLYRLGMADFARLPWCADELRARIEHVLDRHVALNRPQRPSSSGAAPAVSPDHAATASLELSKPEYCSSVAEPNLAWYAVGDPELEAFAAASVARCAGSSESFGTAKSRVVACFERAYLRASLARSSGNIAQAARGAKKHRRAYWALMRKHDIDAAPFRKPTYLDY